MAGREYRGASASRSRNTTPSSMGWGTTVVVGQASSPDRRFATEQDTCRLPLSRLEEDRMSTRKDLAAPVAPETECAFRPSEADAVRVVDGTWEARWAEPDGPRGGCAKPEPGVHSGEQRLPLWRNAC